MDTKLKADIAESAAVTELLKRGFRVLRPVGDRLSYDLGVDLAGKFIRIQVKSAWFNERDKCYIVDARRTKTNRRRMLRQRYDTNDFDFAIVHLADIDVFYVMPVSVFSRYGSTITFVESDKRQRKPRSANYRERMGFAVQWAPQAVTSDGKTCQIRWSLRFWVKVIPSQASKLWGRCRD